MVSTSKAGPLGLGVACLLGLLFVALNVLDAELTSIAISLGSWEMNPFAASFGADPVLKALISSACVAPLLLTRWWRAVAMLCVGMMAVVAWNGVAILTWL